MSEEMDNGFGSDFITIVDEETNEEYELEVVSSMEYNNETYLLLLPADMDEDDDDYGFVILRAGEDENGEQFFESVDEEDTLNEVYERFMAILDEEDEAEGGEEA